MEQEGSEDISQAGADIPDGYPVNSLEYSKFIIEKLILVLGEVTYAYIVATPDSSFIVDLAEYHPGEGCFPFAIAAHEGHFFASFDFHGDFVEHQVAAVSLRGFLSLYHHCS